MDRISIQDRVLGLFSKYKYVILILAAGIVLMSLPERAAAPAQETAQTETSVITPAQELEAVLSQIAGVGKVKVLLTELKGEETIYQTDETKTVSKDSENLRVETIVVTNADRGEAGLVRTVRPPVYLGAIIVCQGGDDARIKLSVVQAVSGATGISSDRITVLKMK